VLVYHSGAAWLPGGFLGVEIFFVISGYLITSLLISERDGTRDTNLGAFWMRRARRLLPAVIVLILGVLTYVAFFLPNELAGLRGDAIAALTYVSNWYLIFEDQSYFESLARPSLLQHLWSLAVEEQFYIIWPILFAVVFSRLRPQVATAVVLAGAACSATLMFVLYEPGTDPSRVYYGTDTRIGGLLIGAALAFIWMPGRLPRAAVADRGIADTFGALAIVGLAAMCVIVGEFDAFLYRGGFVITALLTAVLIGALVHPSTGLLKSILGHPLLVWIGVRSYSIYLWHWPVFMVTRPDVDVSLNGIPLFALRLAITLALAEASFRLVETPIRRGTACGSTTVLA
jgi:peptidoglycan/LPS O-acetylase OafA/YrhL